MTWTEICVALPGLRRLTPRITDWRWRKLAGKHLPVSVRQFARRAGTCLAESDRSQEAFGQLVARVVDFVQEVRPDLFKVARHAAQVQH